MNSSSVVLLNLTFQMIFAAIEVGFLHLINDRIYLQIVVMVLYVDLRERSDLVLRYSMLLALCTLL